MRTFEENKAYFGKAIAELKRDYRPGDFFVTYQNKKKFHYALMNMTYKDDHLYFHFFSSFNNEYLIIKDVAMVRLIKQGKLTKTVLDYREILE